MTDMIREKFAAKMRAAGMRETSPGVWTNAEPSQEERLRERVEALTQALTELADEVESMESLDGRVTVACWQKLEAARKLVE